MSDISPSLNAEIVLRADHRCEYRRLSQFGQEAAFHVDHVVPRTAALAMKRPLIVAIRREETICGRHPPA